MKLTAQQKENLENSAYVVGAGLFVYFVFIKRRENSGVNIDPTGNGSNPPNLGVFNALHVATSLYDAMKNMGTDREAIFEILKTVSQAQFTEVKTAFGKLNYNPVTGDQRNYNPFSVLTKYDLKFWLKSELSNADYIQLRNKYPNHL